MRNVVGCDEVVRVDEKRGVDVDTDRGKGHTGCQKRGCRETEGVEGEEDVYSR